MHFLYSKGSAAEREFAKLLWKWGFAVIRSAGSGRLQYSAPDIVACKNGRIFAFECKFRKNYVHLRPGELAELKEWCSRGGTSGFLAWKIHTRGWWLLDIDSVSGGINEKTMQEKAMSFNDFLSRFA